MPMLSNISIFFQSVSRLIGLLLPIVVALALLFFFWGLAQFIFISGDEDAHEEGRRRMIWGVVALFVMVSVWGLVGFIGSALGVGANTGLNPRTVTIPGVQGVGNGSSGGSSGGGWGSGSSGSSGSSGPMCPPCGDVDQYPECPALLSCL